MWKNSELSSATVVASSVDVAAARLNDAALHNIDRVIALSNFATVNLTIVFLMCRDRIERVFLQKTKLEMRRKELISTQWKRPKIMHDATHVLSYGSTYFCVPARQRWKANHSTQ